MKQSSSGSSPDLAEQTITLLNEAEGSVVEIVSNDKPVAYLVPADIYERMMEQLDDYELSQIVAGRLSENGDEIEVDIEKL